jgi:meso-butanediol dehydrogenase/(S,S)-butanediol dehydrogenase/diacetyl reductase
VSGPLTGRVALITGTGGGQGRAAALRFAAAGAAIAGCDLYADGNEETVAAVHERGGEMTGMAPVDLSDHEQARSWVRDAAGSYRRVDIVYNNASAARFAPVGEMSIEDWQFTIRNELDLVFYVTKYAWPHLCERGGVIINTASTAGHGGSRVTPMVAHAATKGAVIAMTRQLATEGAPHGIRAVSISPGAIATPGTASILADPEAAAMLIGGNLVPRIGLPDDVVSLALFLAGDEASYITGADFVVDGGMLAI